MSWYEATAFESLSLCRALLDKETLQQFDNVLRKYHLDKLCQSEYTAKASNGKEEAVNELLWLKTFLTSVHERSVRLKIPIKKKMVNENGLTVGSTMVHEVSKQDRSPTHASPIAAEATKKPIANTNNDPIPLNYKQRKAKLKAQADKENARLARNKRARETRSQKSSLQAHLRESHLREAHLREAHLREAHLREAHQREAHQRETRAREARATTDKKAAAATKAEEKWCICRKGSFGLMVACDNDDCPYEWFHAECVGLSEAPKSTWYCPKCRPKMERINRAKQKRRKKN